MIHHMLILLPFAGSYSMALDLKQHGCFIKLPSYGFVKGGTFRIGRLGDNATDIGVYFLPVIYDSSFSAASLQLIHVCNRSFVEPPLLRSPRDSANWDGTVNSSMVVVPLITNCRSRRATVLVDFANPNTALDSRELHLPALYISLTVIYTGTCCFFLANQLCFLKLVVVLHSGAGVAAGLKAVGSFLDWGLWRGKGSTGELLMKQQVAAEFLFTVTHTAFFVLNGLAVVGLGTFRSRIPLEEVLAVFLMCFWFFFTWAILHCTAHAAFSVAFVLLSAGGLYVFGRFVYTNLCKAIRLQNLFYPTGDAVMVLKLEIVLRFGGYVTVWGTVLVLATAYVWLTPSWAFLQRVVEEALILAMFLINAAVFFYREEFRSEGHVEADELPVEEIVTDTKLVSVVEPGEEYFAYLIRPAFVP
jgi:hypothetical protein